MPVVGGLAAGGAELHIIKHASTIHPISITEQTRKEMKRICVLRAIEAAAIIDNNCHYIEMCSSQTFPHFLPQHTSIRIQPLYNVCIIENEHTRMLCALCAVRYYQQVSEFPFL